ncbi:hypothetical protein [Lewinella cohaerens]|uniref:hypothetical protein n=1 Tax=Lewinella cohaerens TaxID=70995 RepID=UPI000366D562|nr:hypothetical protein [Lewinella cohaerens]
MRIANIIFSALIVLTLVLGHSCEDNNGTKIEGQEKSVNQDKELLSKKQIPDSTAKMTLRDYQTTQDYYYWNADISDTANYMCSIRFRKEYLEYWFHGQCVLTFFTYLKENDEVEMLWSYKEDCIIDLPFDIRPIHGVPSPKPFSAFAKYSLVAPDKIKVDYIYDSWVKQVNRITGDSIFPVNFFLER